MRDKKGRFAPGNPGGPGNPKMRSLTEQACRIRAIVTDADLERVVRRLVDLAEGGDAQACRMVLDRLAGKAPNAPEPTLGVDLLDVSDLSSLAENACRIASALSEGSITTEQADRILNVYKVVGDALERAQLEERVRVLEERRA